MVVSALVTVPPMAQAIPVSVPVGGITSPPAAARDTTAATHRTRPASASTTAAPSASGNSWRAWAATTRRMVSWSVAAAVIRAARPRWPGVAAVPGQRGAAARSPVMSCVATPACSTSMWFARRANAFGPAGGGRLDWNRWAGRGLAAMTVNVEARPVGPVSRVTSRWRPGARPQARRSHCAIRSAAAAGDANDAHRGPRLVTRSVDPFRLG
jgi:hypothetical protein